MILGAMDLHICNASIACAVRCIHIRKKRATKYHPTASSVMYEELEQTTECSRTPQNDTSKTFRWRAPATILISLACGIAFILAHHFMCNSLNRTPVQDVNISQAWVSRFSTAFAFLVKTTLAIAVGAAYTQHQWLTFHRHNLKMADIDALTSILSNVFGFCNTTAWLRHPVLALTALISW